MKIKLNRQEIRWVVYDIGNSAFILLVSTILPIYFNSISKCTGDSRIELSELLVVCDLHFHTGRRDLRPDSGNTGRLSG